MKRPLGAARSIAFFFVIALLAPTAFNANAQVHPIEITDMTTAIPVTGSDITMQVMATSDLGISLVRVYLWFSIPGDISDTEIIAMDYMGSDIYETNTEVPSNASAMNYYIAAYDTVSMGKNTDVINRDVRDTFPPVAACPSAVQLYMGEFREFNGSASTDNIGIANYTWAFTHADDTIVRYGPNPTVEFPQPYEYAGLLTVTDPWGNTDVQDFSVLVLDALDPISDAGIQMYVVSGNLLFFDGSASSDNFHVANYTWEFIHNGTAVKLYGVSPEYIFWMSGTYDVTLTVSDTSGNTGVDNVSVQVLERPDEDGGIPWWVYVLAVMVVLIMAIAILVIRT